MPVTGGCGCDGIGARTGAAYPNIVFAGPPPPAGGPAGAAGIGRPHVPHAAAFIKTAAPQ